MSRLLSKTSRPTAATAMPINASATPDNATMSKRPAQNHPPSKASASSETTSMPGSNPREKRTARASAVACALASSASARGPALPRMPRPGTNRAAPSQTTSCASAAVVSVNAAGLPPIMPNSSSMRPPAPRRMLNQRISAALINAKTSHQCGAARAASAHGTLSDAHHANHCHASAPV